MVRKIISVLVLVVLFVSVACSALAARPGIILMMAGSKVKASVSISDGKARANGVVTKLDSGYYAETTVGLQKQSGSNWIKVASGSGKMDASISATATKGITYRAYVTCRIYDSTDTCVDTISKASGSKTY